MDISTIFSLLLVAAAVLIPVLMAVAAFFILGRIFYKVPGPDEALVITGRGARPTKEFQEQLAAERAASEDKDSQNPAGIGGGKLEPDPEFKIIVGTGSWLKPGQRMERLSLAAQQADVSLRDVPTVQGINLHTSATVLYKVGDSYSATARAARRFAGNNDWTKMVQDVLESQLRTVVGTMTVEDIWTNREVLSAKVQEASSEELARLGLQIESFGLKPIEDPSGYIANLAAGTLAIADRDAKIAKAEANQQAKQRESETNTAIVNAETQAKIEQAQARQEADRIEAEANQAKPLAEAKARQAVIEEETRNTELEKELNLQRLKATTYQEADAQKYAAIVNATAQSETAIIQAEAQAKATQVAADARKDAAAANAEADAVVTERQAQAEAVRIEAAASAEANAMTLRAKATQAQGEAEAAAAEARGLAQAKVTLEQGKAVGEAERLKAEAMSANKDAVVELELVRQLPAALAANAQAFARVNNITVMDGVEGFQDSISGVLQQGLTSLPAILHALKGTGLSAVSDSFPSFERPIEVAVGVLGGPDGPEKDEQLKALADKVGSTIADSVEKSTKGVTVKGSSAGLADVSGAFSKAAIDIDTTIPGGSVDPAAVFNGVSGGIEQARDLVDQAGEVAGLAQEFLHANQDTIDQLAAAGGKVRRRTR